MFNKRIAVLTILIIIFNIKLSFAQSSRFYIHIYIQSQQLYLIDSETNAVVKKYPVATGKSDTPSPVGCWKITHRR